MSDPKTSRDWIRQNLMQTVIGRPLIDKIAGSLSADKAYDIIVDPNVDYWGGRDKARERIVDLILQVSEPTLSPPNIRFDSAYPYIFATLGGAAIREIVSNDSTPSIRDPAAIAGEQGKQRLSGSGRAIYRIWEDTEVQALLTNSVATVKADAAQAAFSAEGRDIVWAVVDSGIDRLHEHFKTYSNLSLTLPLAHRDFTLDGNSPLTDEFGHGTHVAGIIAGCMRESDVPRAIIRTRDDDGSVLSAVRPLGRGIRGMAPRCRLLSLKVLDSRGKGKTSGVIEAIAAVQKLNDFGRRIIVHGVNLSLGYPFMPEWFACGQSPLCAEVNRLVRSGVVVVAAAGNSGYGTISPTAGAVTGAGLPLTINDPGNAEHAITVGSTHRDMPHTYGVSYFSSKGPTGDGRMKPDLVAPGERILSCAAGDTKAAATESLSGVDRHTTFQYVEDSGTSMAAPHVSGVVAAFLSVRREYIGQPEEVKKIFMDSAIDLKRDRAFQGAGLVDLMRAIQSV